MGCSGDRERHRQRHRNRERKKEHACFGVLDSVAASADLTLAAVTIAVADVHFHKVYHIVGKINTLKISMKLFS